MQSVVSRLCRLSQELPAMLAIDKPNYKNHTSRNEIYMETDWLTANEAAEYVKVQPRTVLQWARERRIPAHRLSGILRCVWRFRKDELDAILCSSSADPAEGRQQ
jgi:excisionase family DNA binding protein